MSNQIQDQKETIQHLEMQLNSAHASIRNTKDLEGVLRMVASDYKLDNQRRNNDYDGNKNDSNEAHVIDTKKEMEMEMEMELEQKLRDLEEEREPLQTVIKKTEGCTARNWRYRKLCSTNCNGYERSLT